MSSDFPSAFGRVDKDESWIIGWIPMSCLVITYLSKEQLVSLAWHKHLKQKVTSEIEHFNKWALEVQLCVFGYHFAEPVWLFLNFLYRQ